MYCMARPRERKSSIPFSLRKNERRASNAKGISLVSLVSMVVLFFLPFVEISCTSTPIRMELTGADLAYGRPAERSPTGENIPPLRRMYTMLIVLPVIGIAALFIVGMSSLERAVSGILLISMAFMLAFLLWMVWMDIDADVRIAMQHNSMFRGALAYQFRFPYMLYWVSCVGLAIGGTMLYRTTALR